MKFSKILLCYSLLFLGSSLLVAQEKHDYLAPMKTNPFLVNYVKQAKKNHTFIWNIISDSIMAKMPFLDDFSHGGPYPNDSLWMDNAAYINNTYPICPINLGVATLDGVNNEGQPINPNCPEGASYPADSLTSRPFNLAAYNPRGDSIYLSFYWQAGGRGYAPQTNDSLLLQFRTSSVQWTTVWYHLGYTPAFPDTSFHLVMLLLTDTMANAVSPGDNRFNPFANNFQFRFKNYACTSANSDQWNIDEVYMNKNRFIGDSIFKSVSFVYESPSLLANYEYMPWEQFTQNDLADTMHLYERNNYNSVLNISYFDTITPNACHYSGGAANMNLFYNTGYNNNQGQIYPPIKAQFHYSPLTGPTNYTITHILADPGDFDPWNDTLKFNQTFSDFYAYDDGTAEAAYFINGATPLGLAEEFTLNNQDTLRGVELYFNYMFVNPESYSMRLSVWDNTGPSGSPGNLKFEDDTVVYPIIGDSLDGYTYYPLHSPTPLVYGAGASIYVGWIQTYGDSLNIGFDLNTNSQNKIYYNADAYPSNWPSGWNPGDYAGSLMMRPVFGHVNAHTHSINDVATENAGYKALSIYPNPASNLVTLSISMPGNTMLKIFTADGREYINNDNFSGNAINTSTFPAGFYIVELTPNGGSTVYQKLLIQR